MVVSICSPSPCQVDLAPYFGWLIRQFAISGHSYYPKPGSAASAVRRLIVIFALPQEAKNDGNFANGPCCVVGHGCCDAGMGHEQSAPKYSAKVSSYCTPGHGADSDRHIEVL